jgi:hypothetical protein
MKRSARGGASRYARAIESRWSELLGRPVVFSPRDWSKVARWHALRIPLEIVEEAMGAALEQRRAREGARGIAELAPRIEEAWSVILDGRRSPPRDPGASPAPEPWCRWRRRIEMEAVGSPLAKLLEELLGRLEGGEAGVALDEELDRRLAGSVASALRDRVFAEVTEETEPFRARMSADRLEATRRRASVDRLRRALDLPRLARGPGEA